jgi:hypothetical protein
MFLVGHPTPQHMLLQAIKTGMNIPLTKHEKNNSYTNFETMKNIEWNQSLREKIEPRT